MKEWIHEKLSHLLQFPVPDDLTDYILKIRSTRDLEEYLKTLLNFDNPDHRKFVEELVKKQQSGFGESLENENVHVYKKCEQNYVDPKITDKKKKGKAKDEDILNTNLQTEQKTSQSLQKKKTKYVNLYSQEGKMKDQILLKGRHKCNCQATKHKLISNCLSCGRIVCEQEGSGPCFFCDTLVCTAEEQNILRLGSKRSNQLQLELLNRSKASDWDAAIEQRDRLIEYDKTSEVRTRVIDDECDYYSTSNIWLSKEEKSKLKKKEDEIRSKIHSSRLDRTVTIDFAGRKIVEEEVNYSELYRDSDLISKEKNDSQVFDVSPDVFNSLYPELIILQNQATISNERKNNDNEINVWNNGIHQRRVQDREFLEMSDEGVCLSMHQPWASLLVYGIKKDEGRSWYSAHRGRLWIAAASKTPTAEEIKDTENVYRILVSENVVFPDSYPTSCLLGCVNVTDCLPQEEYRLRYPEGESECPFVFVCEDPQILPFSFPIQGKHKIYKLDPKIHMAAQKTLQRQAKIQAKSTNAKSVVR